VKVTEVNKVELNTITDLKQFACILLPHPALQKAKANHGIAKPLLNLIYFFGCYFKKLVSIGSVDSLLYKHQYIHISCAFKIVNHTKASPS
jgi:hypothetical protein